MQNFLSKTSNHIQVGLHLNQQHIDVCYFDQQNQPHFFTQPQSQASHIVQKIMENLATDKVKLRFISALSPHHIWYKSLLLPQQLNATECDQQCRFILEQELPIPLNELWFDYRTDCLKQGFKLELFAVKKDLAKDYLRQFFPLQINVLDSITHSILRATEYLAQTRLDKESVVIYQDSQLQMAIQPLPHQNVVLQQTYGNLTALLSQFCQRYTIEPQQIFVYRQNAESILNARLLETELPFIALGNALWQSNLS